MIRGMNVVTLFEDVPIVLPSAIHDINQPVKLSNNLYNRRIGFNTATLLCVILNHANHSH
jgi:hypothetical protein